MNLRAYAELVRLPNVFTAPADVLLGACAAHVQGHRFHWGSVVAASLASACLYAAGMVWNDYFDLDQDRQERPTRPLPSGRVRLNVAMRLASALTASGILLGAAMGVTRLDPAPALAASALAGCIALYDAWLKRTILGPFAMGSCRVLNVVLGAVAVGMSLDSGIGYVAGTLGLYVAGLTWFARTEAIRSSRIRLVLAATAMLAGLLCGLLLPALPVSRALAPAPSVLFPYLILALGLWLGWPIVRALEQPLPAMVQAAVKRAVFGIVAFDATVATAMIGTRGLLILILLAPAVLIGRRIYST